ncbi:MAG: hypothetical protein ACOCRX_01305 [Candidatus Woesearchaeota archaeon]
MKTYSGFNFDNKEQGKWLEMFVENNRFEIENEGAKTIFENDKG